MTTLIHDDFAGSNGTIHGRTPSPVNLPAAPIWVQKGGTTTPLNIAGNKVVGTSETVNGICTIETGEADCQLHATVSASSDTTDFIGFVFRLSDNNNYFQARIKFNGFNNILFLQRITNGSYSLITNTPNMGGNAFSTLTVRMEMVGTLIKFYSEGLLVYQFSDVFNQTATKHGIYAIGQSQTLDDYYVTDAGGIGATTPTLTADGILMPTEVSETEVIGVEQLTADPVEFETEVSETEATANSVADAAWVGNPKFGSVN